MTRNNRLTVTIRQVPGDSETYIATFSSPVLSATFCVVFPNSITGAIALHDFAEMLHHRFGRSVNLCLDTDLLPVTSKAIDDVLQALRERRLPINAG